MSSDQFEEQAVPVEALEELAETVLWLATRIIDHANNVRPNSDGVKVGGHQASCASMVSIMTALWFAHLDREDRVSVKPHASPVLHAINFLLGHLEQEQLETLREFGGLQAYPSRTKDVDPVDFSTGSVGLGATAPLFAAATRRYVDHHFGSKPPSRFISLIGDAELDEGNIWEALLDPAVAGLGNVLWVVDLNRQSLDRVVPGMKVRSLAQAFADVSWQVIEVKYGRKLEAAFARPGGDRLRERIDDMPNDEYQATFGMAGDDLRSAIAAADNELWAFLEPYDDAELAALIGDLGGHDIGALVEGLRKADTDPNRPAVLFAYTVKGWRLPFAGDPMNHSALLTTSQVDELRSQLGRTEQTEWDRPSTDSVLGQLCTATADRLCRLPASCSAPPEVPTSALGATPDAMSTQQAFGRVLSNVARTALGDRIVTVAPDVSVSTNLGGWINKVGVYSQTDKPDRASASNVLKWVLSPEGQHIELGISEMNLFSYLGQLGMSWDLSGETLIPVGTVYDPFVCRGLDAFIYSLYNGARFVIAGTPSGVTLAPEGGAHQSTVTASIGMELPGVTLVEPASARALDWLLCDGMERVADLGRPAESLYLRLSTRPIDQAPFEAAIERLGAEAARTEILAGGYRLIEVPADGRPRVQLAGSGPVLQEMVAASAALAAEGIAAPVLDLTSQDRLYRSWVTSRRAPIRSVTAGREQSAIDHLLEPNTPIVTVHDAASHAMAWLGSVHGNCVVPLGVDDFGQSGTVADLYRAFDLTTGAIVNAAILAAG